MMYQLITVIVETLTRWFWSVVPRCYRKITDIGRATETLKESTYSSRARANRHLLRAFGIMNPFVNGDTKFHDDYVKKVRQRLAQVITDWSGVVGVAIRTSLQLPSITGIEDVRKDVRVIIMSVALEILGVDGYSPFQLVRASELINTLWMRAKKGLATDALREELHTILRAWEPGEFVKELGIISSISDERALLSILIPVYETMYRVVLPLIYHTHQTISFIEFLRPEVKLSQLSVSTGYGYTYLALIQETLRRYPVVKRIKRSSLFGDVAVDIEAIHLDGSTWENSNDFEPRRWTKMDGRGGFMPFGNGTGRCVANERIVGMVVSIALAAVEGKFSKMEKSELEGLLLNDRETENGTQ
jgi:hypothetical protein